MMLEWIDKPVVTLPGEVTITRLLVIAALLTLVLAGIALRKRRNPFNWYAAGLAGFVLASQIVAALIPPSHLKQGETPGATYTIWSNAAFRSDVALVLVLGVLAIILYNRIRLAMWAVDSDAQAAAKDKRPAPPRRLVYASAVGSALWLLLPIIIWFWAAIWLVAVGDYGDLILPILGFVALTVTAGLLWHFLEGRPRNLVFVALFALLLVVQTRYNRSHPSVSLFESSGAVPVFMPLIPVLLGIFMANIVRGTLPRRAYILMVWKLGTLAWITTALGFLIKFLGYYDYQNSYAFDMGSLLDTPIQLLAALTDLYYKAVPREIAPEKNAANMEHWRIALAALGGLAVWLGITIYLLLKPARGRQFALNAYLTRVRSYEMTLSQRRYVLAAALLVPALALRTFTTFYPFLQTLFLSVQKYNPAFPPRSYVGLRNFERLSTDLVVRESLEFTLIFVFASTFFQITLGVAIAHLLNANFRLRPLARTISLVPWAVPMVVAAIGFRWMFDDQFGMIPDFLQRVFDYNGKWLVHPRNARIAILFVSTWKSTPFVALLLLAGLQGINQDMYEAAKVDGANWLDTLRFITFPMLLPIMVTTGMFMLVWQLAVFDLPFAMTGGAPGFSTTVMSQKIYLEINSLNYSYAAALSVALVTVVTLIGGLGMYIFRRVEVAQ
jgi:multiple sugar transport system permease protein